MSISEAQNRDTAGDELSKEQIVLKLPNYFVIDFLLCGTLS